MKIRFTAVALLIVTVVALAGAASAFAGGPTDQVIHDASNGTVDGNWSAAQIAAALSYLKHNPVYSQYSDVEGVLQDYLDSLGAPGAVGAAGAANGSGQLAFTGADTVVIIGAGLALIAGGVFFRRRTRA